MGKMSTLPGPGTYGAGNVERLGRVRSTPSFSFGAASVRDPIRKIPGPGEYTPYDPNWSTRPKSLGLESKMPGPGQYEGDAAHNAASSLGKIPISFGRGKPSNGRPQPKSDTPGPGSYLPSHSQTCKSLPTFGFGTASRSREELYVASQCPGPATYQQYKLSSASG